MATSGKVRIQLDLAPAEAAALDELRSDCGLRSRADAVRVALGIVEWVNSEVAQGRHVLAVGDGMVSRLVMPGLTTGRVGKER